MEKIQKKLKRTQTQFSSPFAMVGTAIFEVNGSPFFYNFAQTLFECLKTIFYNFAQTDWKGFCLIHHLTHSNDFLRYMILLGKNTKKLKRTQIQFSSPFAMVGTAIFEVN